EINRAIVPLQHLEGLGKADSAATFLGGEVKLKNLFLNFVRDSGAFVFNLSHYRLLLAPGRDHELPTLGHSLDAVQHDVEDGLLHEVGIYADRQICLRNLAVDLDAVLRRVGSRQHHYIFDQATQVHLLKMQVARPGEVHQDLHHAIKAMNFIVNDIHVPAGVGIDLLQLGLQQLKVQHDRVDRIFHLVSNAPCEPPAGGKPARGFDLVFNLAD